MFGRSIKHIKSSLVAGTNHLVFNNTETLPPGVYTLRIKAGNSVLSKSVVKVKN